MIASRVETPPLRGTRSCMRGTVAASEPRFRRDGAMHRESVLLVTLGSRRSDTFAAVRPANILAFGPFHRAHAPSQSAFASHAAMFAGFTPGVATSEESFVNPRRGRGVRLEDRPSPAFGRDPIRVAGECGRRAHGFSHPKTLEVPLVLRIGSGG
jgi:hypothetical protein